jgi:hypothetical protein
LFYTSADYIQDLALSEYKDLLEIVFMEDEEKQVIAFNRYISNTENLKLLQNIFPIICTTCISAHKLGGPEPSFDMTIIDEASQCNTAVSLVPIIRGNALMLVGDPQQLNPVITLDANINENLKENYTVSDDYDYISNSIYKSFLANDSESTTNKNLIIDTAQINSFLINSGFTNMEVSNQIGANVDIKMTIPKNKTFIFDSKLVFSDNSGVNSNFGIELSTATLQTFYANADEQIISILDILISPAFYGEEISEEEYIETIASLYGNDVADEMNKSEIHITLKNKSGKVVKKSLPLKTLLTLKQSVKIGW